MKKLLKKFGSVPFSDELAFWGEAVLLVQVTVSPTLMVMSAGL
jgi:hypothetical protein